MLGLPRVLIATGVIAACDLSTVSDQASTPGNAIRSRGLVAGFVQDSSGRAVSNAVVCATGLFDFSGTPGVVSNQGPTDANGAFVVPLELSFATNTRGSLTVAATPATTSGLAPAYKPDLTVLISPTLPPPETTRVTIVVPEGTPYNGVFCVAGG